MASLPPRRPGGARPRPLKYNRTASTASIDNFPQIDAETPTQADFQLDQPPVDRKYVPDNVAMSPPPRPEPSSRNNSWMSRGSITLSDPPVRRDSATDAYPSRSSTASFVPSPSISEEGRNRNGPFADSPQQASPQSFSPIHSPPPQREPQLRRNTPSITSLTRAIERASVSTTDSSDPALVRTHSRWDSLRRYAVGTPPANATGFATPPPVPQPLPPPSNVSVTSFNSMVPPGPPPIPYAGAAAPVPTAKTPRLGRFGFRQVVEQATTQVNLDVVARFEHDLRRACWEGRYGGSGVYLADRDAQGFGSNMSLATAATSSFNLPLTSGESASSRPGMRRPPSLPAVPLAGGFQQPSVHVINQVLLAHAPLTTTTTGPSRANMPLEEEVLSVLLSVYLDAEHSKRMEDERWLAVETFEMITKTWRSSSPEAELERWLWCIKVAASPGIIPPLWNRTLGILSNLLMPSNLTFAIQSPIIMQTLIRSLIHLRRTADDPIIQATISRIARGDCGTLTAKELTDEYGVFCTASDEDREPQLRVAVIAEGALRGMQVGSEAARRWSLRHVEEYWAVESDSDRRRLSSLEIQVQLRKITTFSRLSLLLTRPTEPLEDPLAARDDATTILRIIQTRALPELARIDAEIPEAAQARRELVRLALDVLCLGGSRATEQVGELIGVWWADALRWRGVVSKEIMENLSSATEWPLAIRMTAGLVKGLKPEIRQVLVVFTLPLLYERLIDDPPTPSPALTALLSSLAETVPTLFYKPLFLCAASGKDATVIIQLRILISLAKHLPTFWTANDEMVAVALMSNPGNSTLLGDGTTPLIWSKPRLGQCVVILELISHIKKLTGEKKDPNAALDNSKDPAVKFVGALEARLAIMMDARERSSLLPFSHRTLLTWLLLEMRIYTRNLRSAPWLPRIVSWACQAYNGAPIALSSESPFDDNTPTHVVDAPPLEEWSTTKDRMLTIYAECSDKARPTSAKRHSQYRMSFLLAGVPNAPNSDAAPNLERQKLLSSSPATLRAATLSLLVAVCGLMGPEEQTQLSGPLWTVYLDDQDRSVLASACFLIMQCAEKAQSTLLPLLVGDLTSSDAKIRLRAVDRISKLFSLRLQILTQNFIPDRARRRPFRLARRPIAFVASDVGSGRYVPPERAEQTKLHLGSTLPPEVRRRVLELGWGENDEEEEKEARRWDRAPISLLPHNELELLGLQQPKSTTDAPNETANKGLLRRKSSGSNYIAGIKRKAIFVPPLLSVVPYLANMLMDSDPLVSATANDLIMLLMRDDPALIVRPLMEDISDAMQDTAQAIRTLRIFLHAQPRLPPGLTHHVFNHLAGLLRTSARQSGADSARIFALCLPILGDLVPQVSEVSYRDLCRNKLDSFVLPTFSPIPSSLLTQGLSEVTYAAMARTAQNMLLVNVLRQDSKDINGIRKGYAQLQAFSVTLEDELHLQPLCVADLIPRRVALRNTASSGIAHHILPALGRSYLLLCTQFFRSLSRHLNNRGELGKYIEGINRIVLARSGDIGVVSHALIAYMTASTRFRRMFSTESGFTLFMPTLLKLYAEAQGRSDIRCAIEYAVRRFYALHKEVFIFQALEAASYMVHQPQMAAEDEEWFAANVYDLIASLGAMVTTREPDLAGINGVNKMQEQEALITMVNEKPELLLPSLSRTTSHTTIFQELPGITATDNDFAERALFPLDDFVRLFLTIVPHNPFIVRAQYFLKLLRLLTPNFYNASPTARNVLRDGIQAFGTAVFDRLQGRPKGSEKEKTAEEPHATEPVSDETAPNRLFDTKPTAPSDQAVMRREYILLVVAYIRAGGLFDKWTMQRILHLIKDTLRDGAHLIAQPASQFLAAYSALALRKDGGASVQRHAASLLREIVPVFRLYGSILDFTSVLEHITSLARDEAGTMDREFCQMIVSDWCGPAVDMCHIAADEGALSSMPARKAVISLIAASIALPGVDVLATIERQRPSSRFLSGIVLPLCLVLETSQQVAARTQWQDLWKQEAHKKAWVRLLAYAMSVQHAVREGTAAAGDSPPSKRNSFNEKAADSRGDNEPGMAFMIGLQITKLITVRAETDISSVLPGIWTRVANFLRESLRDGDASFALQQARRSIHLVQPSPPMSPADLYNGQVQLASPTIGPERPFSFELSTNRRSSSSMHQANRLVDYLLWSTLELVCLHRSPLLLQLKLWMQEKMLAFDEKIRSSVSLNSPGGGFPSPLLAGGGLRDSRRVSTIFAKPRQRNTGYRSNGASPEGSPAFGAIGGGGQTGLSRSPSLLSLGPRANTRTAGLDSPLEKYDRFPNASPTPGASSGTGPRILHLGPTKRVGLGLGLGRLDSDARRKLEGEEEEAMQRAALTRVMVTAPHLVQASHWRVRVVQSSMGYDPLPLDSDGDVGDDADVRAWSRARAALSIVAESRALLKEFEEWFGSMEAS